MPDRSTPVRIAPVRVAIVIVNYRTPELVKGCLDSLVGEAGAGADGNDMEIRAFVGDAQSGDGSVETINAHIAARGYGDWALCYDIGKNGGFAYGNNAIVAEHVAPDPSFTHVHFLNPDTYIHPGAVRALADFLSAHPRAGVAGSRLEDPDGTPRAYGFRFPTPWREFFRGARFGLLDRLVPGAGIKIEGLEETARVDWVTGASFMMPRAVLEAVGPMDDGFFLYFEETEQQARVQDAGYEVWHVADSRVVHLAGQSTGVRSGDAEIKRLSPVWLTSRARFMRLRFGGLRAAIGTGLFLLGDLFYRAHRRLRGKTVENPPHLWRDYLGGGS